LGGSKSEEPETGNQNEYKNGKKVLACLQRSLRIADTCMDSALNVKLFVEILNEYLYYFEDKNDAVAVKYLTGLIALIKTHLANIETGAEDENELAENVKVYFENTLEHIKRKKENGESVYSQIEF